MYIYIYIYIYTYNAIHSMTTLAHIRKNRNGNKRPELEDDPARSLLDLLRSGLVWSVLFCSGLVWSALFCSGLVWSVLFWSVLVWSGLFCSGLFWSGLFWSVLVWPELEDDPARSLPDLDGRLQA